MVCIFGNKYDGMLLTLLYSLKKNIDNANCYVFYQDNSELFNSIKKTFHDFEFIKTSFSFSENKVLRISSKTLMWSEAILWIYKNKKSIFDYAIFLDVDTLVLKDPIIILSESKKIDADVLITVKDEEKWPINTGVIITKITQKTCFFFQKWQEDTFKLFNSEQSLYQASSVDYPYGGVDQMSMHKIVEYSRNANHFYLKNCCGLNIKKILCTNFNQTNSMPINDDIFIIHYKGVWQHILLHGENFTKYRRRIDSMQMYEYYLNMYKSSVEYLRSKCSDPKFNYFNCGIFFPSFMKTKNPIWRHFLYSIYYVGNKFKHFSTMIKKAKQTLIDKFQYKI